MFQEAAAASHVVDELLRRNRSLAVDLGARLRAMEPRGVVLCGRGSSDHAGLYARYLIETGTGLMTSAAAPSIASIYAGKPQLRNTVCITISQSGQSPDLLAAVGAARQGGAFVIALVNVETSPLADLADVVLPLHAGPENSVAATKTFIASLAAVAQLTACWVRDDALTDALDALPARLETASRLDWSAARDTLTRASNLYVVGRGPGLGVASEAALKLKETAGLHAEAFSAAEVRHGPMALVKRGFPVLVLPQDDESRDDTLALAAEFAARGAQVMLAGETAAPGGISLPTVKAHPAIQPILMIQSFYRLAAEVAVARGYDPDRPPYLNKVTETV
ncbi:SIS domain-containing protein [Brevundimonas sp. NPDC092305]|uniref:SIS domain-containing protein n=1 Tax=Brevundimonas sp. NPDC092305 TaxID=3363957 RepID=UPI00382103ED